MPPRGRTLAEARFDDKLRTYLFLQGVALCVGTIVGILALPFWLLLGGRWARRYWEHLACTLTDRALVVKKGIWFRSENTVPLDRIQDVSIRHGPFLDWLGLATMRVDTAGAGAAGQGSINLTGVVDTVSFRDRVLEARDRSAGYRDDEEVEVEPGPPARGGPGDATGRLEPGSSADATALLADIRDSLVRIEGLLAPDRE
ncbi:MAG: PH domain-containing protein [Gemmatimonadota bacterium]|jgi:putative membrane protein